MTTPGSIVGVLAGVRSTFAEGERAVERALRDGDVLAAIQHRLAQLTAIAVTDIHLAAERLVQTTAVFDVAYPTEQISARRRRLSQKVSAMEADGWQIRSVTPLDSNGRKLVLIFERPRTDEGGSP